MGCRRWWKRERDKRAGQRNGWRIGWMDGSCDRILVEGNRVGGACNWRHAPVSPNFNEPSSILGDRLGGFIRPASFGLGLGKPQASSLTPAGRPTQMEIEGASKLAVSGLVYCANSESPSSVIHSGLDKYASGNYGWPLYHGPCTCHTAHRPCTLVGLSV